MSKRARKGGHSLELRPPLGSASSPTHSGQSCRGKPPGSYLGVLQLQLLFLVLPRLLRRGPFLWWRLASPLSCQLPFSLWLSLCRAHLWLWRLSPLLRAVAGREGAARDTGVFAAVGGGTEPLALWGGGRGAVEDLGTARLMLAALTAPGTPESPWDAFPRLPPLGCTAGKGRGGSKGWGLRPTLPKQPDWEGLAGKMAAATPRLPPHPQCERGPQLDDSLFPSPTGPIAEVPPLLPKWPI